MKVDYHALTALMVSHSEAEVVADSKDDTYFITQSYSAAIIGNKPVSVLVKFAGFTKKPELSETSDSSTRDAIFVFIFIVEAEDDDASDVLIDAAIMDFEYYLEYDRQGDPIFGSLLIEQAEVISGKKNMDVKMKGLHGVITLKARVMEE